MKNSSDIIQAALKEGRKALFEYEAKDLARSVGIIVPKFVIIDPHSEKDIVAAAEKLGFPVALKAVSAEILHKTEAGAVILDIKDATALAGAVKHMKTTVPEKVPGAKIRAFLLEKMMPQGLEVLIGGLQDRQFGPAVSFGLGGVWVEAFKDAAFGILPMSHEEMQDMIAQTQASRFLKGFRGSPPLDEEAVHLMITNLSRLLTDHPEIAEIDMNPVRVYSRGAAALDVRVILA